MPFEDSRRLTGANLFFAATGAVLDARIAMDDALLHAWRERVQQAGARLRWAPKSLARRHAGGTLLAIAAPYDQLFLATEVNEWALCASLVEREPAHWAGLEQALIAAALDAAEDSQQPSPDSLPVLDAARALARFERLASLQTHPKLRALLDAADSRELPHVVDESAVTLGSGVGSRSFALAALPNAADIPWRELHDIPTAIVTGSNGKTTTVRLLAACARSHGWHAGYNCTDGVFLDDDVLATGDYSGPAGARLVLRERRTQAAILETARGGILRRGIAVSRANVAVITNVSADHFGEYGIDDLAGLADVKLTVAAVVAAGGLLVLNADDAQLRARAGELQRRFESCPPLGWFAVGEDQETLHNYGLGGASICGVRQGGLHLTHRGAQHDLGRISAMPLSLDGIAVYNIANMAAAALAAVSLGIAPATIAAVFARFGSSPHDNPGRLMRFEVGGVIVLVDYAHNPDGLRGFLKVAAHLRRGAGRLGLLLGHAGNRQDKDIEELAQTAAEFRPDLIVIKEDEAHLRGRAPGEVPRILHAELERLGFPESKTAMHNSELEAVRNALDWARPGDVLALPVHSSSARAAVVAMLDTCHHPFS